MSILPHTAHRAQRWPVVYMFVLLIVFVGADPRLTAAQETQSGWKVALEEGKTTRSTLRITNRCPDPHRFRVENDIKYLKFEEPTDSILIAPGERIPLSAIFDSTGLKSRVYRDEVTVSCIDCKSKKTRCSQDRDKVPVELTVTKPSPPQFTSAAVSVGIRFRWSGIIRADGGGGGGGGCDAPLGICLIIGFPLNPVFSTAQIADGYGTGTFQVVDDRLRMVFHREAALRDGTIPIPQDHYLKPDVATALGFESIMLKSGVYKVDKSKERFGEILVDIVKGGKSPPPVSMAAVTCQRYANTTGNCKGCGVACNDGTNYPMSCSADLFADITRCGGQKIEYDNGTYGQAELSKAIFETSVPRIFPDRKLGIMETFDTLGLKNTCSGEPGPGAAAGILLRLLIPRLQK